MLFHDSDPHGIAIDELNELLNRVEHLFKASSDAERIYLMTIVPADWGRFKICNWFGVSDHQA